MTKLRKAIDREELEAKYLDLYNDIQKITTMMCITVDTIEQEIEKKKKGDKGIKALRDAINIYVGPIVALQDIILHHIDLCCIDRTQKEIDDCKKQLEENVKEYSAQVAEALDGSNEIQ